MVLLMGLRYLKCSVSQVVIKVDLSHIEIY